MPSLVGSEMCIRDRIATALNPASATLALVGSTEEEQFSH